MFHNAQVRQPAPVVAKKEEDEAAASVAESTATEPGGEQSQQGGAAEPNEDPSQAAAATEPPTKEDLATEPQAKAESVPSAKSCKTKEDVVQYIKDRVVAIRAFEEKGFNNSVVLENLKGISRMYFDRRQYRQDAAQALVENDFSGLVKTMLEYFNKIGVFHNDDTWFPCYYTLSDAWNFTDCSKELCVRLTDAGVVPMLLSNITHKPYLENISNKNVLSLIKSSLSILSNIIARVPEAKPVYADNNAVQAVKPFLHSDNVFLKLVAMLLFTNIISEQENAELEDTGAINYMITCLRSALKSPKRRHRGFAPDELAEGLGRMAVNDSNKMKIIDKKALPLLVEMMKVDDEGEQFPAVQCLWTLAFGEEARQHIKDEPGCMEELERLSQSNHSNIARAAKGALWILKEEGQQKEKEKEAERAGSPDDIDKSKNHIFISYNWDHQTVVLQLRDRLKADGYRVWVDVDQMGGSTLEAMAEAVENASVVLISLSEKYKLSPNCRTEAEYTFQLHKQIVPLMMQRRYRADGWLGMLVGAKLYINFDGKHSFDDAYQMLLKEIAGRGKEGNIVETAVASTLTGAAPPARGKSGEVKGWSKEQVSEWLAQNDLGGVQTAFSQFDGKLLVRFNKIRHEAPDFFYKALDRKLTGDTLSLCMFAEALDELLQ